MKIKLLCLLLLSFFACALHSNAQNSHKKITISGYVTDSVNNPVPGAIIMIDHKVVGCSTDEKGFYKVKVKPDASLITVFFLLDRINMNLPINGATRIDFVLPMKALGRNPLKNSNQSEESVNIGYGSSKIKDVSSQVKKIDVQKSRYAGYKTIYELIAAEVPGAIVKGTSVRIDGINSVNPTDPLFVVDGVIVGSVEDILPHQVKSISVLRGASAAIYGSQGGNGVILIDLVRPDHK
jgi:TonB-dependent starch-binding outer membrane protein SusC